MLSTFDNENSTLFFQTEAAENAKIVVKNLFGFFDVLFQAFMTRLTPIIKTRHFLKLTCTDRNNLAALHSFIQTKESKFRV